MPGWQRNKYLPVLKLANTQRSGGGVATPPPFSNPLIQVCPVFGKATKIERHGYKYEENKAAEKVDPHLHTGNAGNPVFAD